MHRTRGDELVLDDVPLNVMGITNADENSADLLSKQCRTVMNNSLA